MTPWFRLAVIALVVANIGLLAWHFAAGPVREVTTPAPSPVSSILPDTPRLVLLSELPPPASSGGLLCFTVGPFETIASRESARERLLRVADAIDERESEALIELGYWVTLPPFSDFAAAGAAMRRLNQAGLRDTAVVSDASGEYRVSLGYFLDQANARRRRDHARSLDFEAEIGLQRESQPRYWLDYERQARTIELSRPPEGIPASQHRSIACPAAPTSQGPGV